MTILIDMNLSPAWVEFLNENGYHAVHWKDVGKWNATDSELFQYAQRHDFIIFTHDLDFGILLALTHGKGPSVVQIRTQNIAPENSGEAICSILSTYKRELEKGALITIDSHKARVRVLPIKE